MRIGLEVVEFFAILAVADVAPVAIDDCIFFRVHVLQIDVAVFGGRWIGERPGQRFTFQLLVRFGQTAELDQRRIHVDQTDGGVGLRTLGDARPGPEERDIGSSFPQRVFPPVAFLAVVITVIAPQDDDRVVGVRTGFERIQDASHHGVGITDAREISMNRVVDGLQVFQLLMNAGPRRLHLLNLRRQIVEITSLVRRQCDLSRFVEVEISLRAVVGIVRGINADAQEERLVVLFLQLFDSPVDANRVRHFLFAFVRDRSPLKKQAAGDLLAFVVNAVWKWVGKRRSFAPRIQRPTTFALALVSQEKLVPSANFDGSFGMMKELAGSKCLVAGFGKADLQGFDFRMIDKEIRRLITARGRRVLPGKDGSPAGGTEDSGRVRVREIHSARSQAIEVRSNGPSRRLQTPDPVVHVIDSEEQNVGFRFCSSSCLKEGHQEGRDNDAENLFHGWLDSIVIAGDESGAVDFLPAHGFLTSVFFEKTGPPY